MILSITGTEVLLLMETLLKNPIEDPKIHERIYGKLRRLLTESLEDSDEKESIESYRRWISSEQARIDDLRKKNASIYDPLGGKTSKKHGGE